MLVLGQVPGHEKLFAQLYIGSGLLEKHVGEKFLSVDLYSFDPFYHLKGHPDVLGTAFQVDVLQMEGDPHRAVTPLFELAVRRGKNRGTFAA